MKYTTEELETSYSEIKKNANPIYAFFGALIGALPAVALYFFYGEMGGALYIMLALPPLIVGFAAKFIGRTYSIKHRLAVGIIGALVHILGCYLIQFSPIIYMLAPVAFAIAFTTAKIKLEPIQSHALASANFGKIGTNQ